MTERIRVLVVDDSALMRKLIPQILQRDPSIEVVGTAIDGCFGLKKIEELKPHVVTLDLEMPAMDGLDVLRIITRMHRLPVIVVSAHTTQGASSTMRALGLGAFDFVAKPRDAAAGHLDEIAVELATKIKVAAKAGAPGLAIEPPVKQPGVKKQAPRERRSSNRIIGIGVSTGGPNALQYVFSQLPADFPGSIVVVQHMPEGFTEMFARRLNESSAIDVQEAKSGDLLLAGRALICPGDRHIVVRRMGRGNTVALVDKPRVNGHRPSADVLFRSLAEEFGGNGVAVLMTGMGDDGAEGLGVVRAAGGMTIAQSVDSCVVDGMPRAAIERGYTMRVIPLEGLANALVAHCVSDKPPSKSDAVPATPDNGVR